MRLVLIVFSFIFLGFFTLECAAENIENLLHIQPKTSKPNIIQSTESKTPAKNATDAHIPTWELYRAYLREANAAANDNSTSKFDSLKNITSKLLPNADNLPSEKPRTNSTNPTIPTSNNTAVNISYVDFLMNFANITVQYLPNVTITNESITIQNTVYDRQLENRTFQVDYDKNEFQKDGQTFQYAAGEFHYFRSFQDTWLRKMRAMRAAGLNVISTYIEWSTHNPQDDDQYVWTGFQDVEKFFRMAIEEDMLIILRPSPYICAERNGGGFPFWLVAKYPHIRLRTTDPDYLHEVRKWFAEMMPRFIPYLYENGGPIIMVQVENEYGVYGCNHDYQHWIRDETDKYVRGKAVLFTNDIKDKPNVKCGKIDGVLATIDFSTDPDSVIDGYWNTLRQYQPNGPCVNSEFYTGWETYWFDKKEAIKVTDQVVSSLDHQFKAGCSVNIYMFHGGTNYGFSTSMGGIAIGVPSYDYNAAVSEAGDITDRYYAIRNVIKQYLPMPNIHIPANESKMVLPSVELRPQTTLFSKWARFLLGTEARQSNTTLLFENFTQDAGFMLYETQLDDSIDDHSSLQITGLHDRAIVYVDNNLVGILARTEPKGTVQINNGQGSLLQIFVENLGRQSYGILSERKGIVGNVLLNNNPIEKWNITGFPFANYTGLGGLIDALGHVQQDHDTLKRMSQTSKKLNNDPIIYEGKFDIEGGAPNDTFIDARGWGKGFLYINGFNLGRYWPLAGPQMTVYLPKEILKKQNNVIVVIEMEQAPENNNINFIDSPLYMDVVSDEI